MSTINTSNEKTWRGIKIGAVCAAACAAGALALVSQAWASAPAEITRADMINHISTQCYPAKSALAAKIVRAVTPGLDNTVVGIVWMGRDALPVVYEKVVNGGEDKLSACRAIYDAANAHNVRVWGTGHVQSGMK